MHAGLRPCPIAQEHHLLPGSIFPMVCFGSSSSFLAGSTFTSGQTRVDTGQDFHACCLFQQRILRYQIRSKVRQDPPCQSVKEPGDASFANYVEHGWRITNQPSKSGLDNMITTKESASLWQAIWRTIQEWRLKQHSFENFVRNSITHELVSCLTNFEYKNIVSCCQNATQELATLPNLIG